MTANLLRWRGFDVVELGADTPADALAEAVGRAADVLALGVACTTSGTERAASTAIARVRRLSRNNGTPRWRCHLGCGPRRGRSGRTCTPDAEQTKWSRRWKTFWSETIHRDAIFWLSPL